jgi:lysophospholipase L1-like esterase
VSGSGRSDTTVPLYLAPRALGRGDFDFSGSVFQVASRNVRATKRALTTPGEMAYHAPMAFRPLRMLSLAIFPVGALYYVNRRANEPPQEAPHRFLARGGAPAGAKVCACLGASIVHGRVSADWVGTLGRRLAPDGFVLVNAGVNGDLAYNARQRLGDVIACRPDFVVVLVGTNDVLATMSPRHEARYRRSNALPVRPTREWYRENLTGIVDSLRRETQARVGLCSLPVLGEDLESRANRTADSYSSVVEEVAAATGAAYLPVREAMIEALRASGGSGRAYGGATWPMLAAAVRRYVLGYGLDEIGERNGYRLLTEGVHLASRGGGIVADVVEKFLRDNRGR